MDIKFQLFKIWCFTTTWIYLTLLNCTLKLVKMVNFRLCVLPTIKNAKYSIPKFNFYTIIIKYLRHFEKLKCVSLWIFFKASGIKVYNLQSNCQLNYIKNWLKDPFYYSMKYTFSTYCFDEIYTIPLVPTNLNINIFFLLAATCYSPFYSTPSLTLLVHKFNS